LSKMSITVTVMCGMVLVGGCAQAEPINPSFVREYTGLQLCQGATVRDLTTAEERDTTPGFTFHVELAMSPSCTPDFEQQLGTMGCPTPLSRAGCGVQDTSKYGVTERHTSLSIHPTSEGRYDLRFYQ
jgi:hypothetical protein